MKRVGITLIALLTLSGCGKDWFGNPTPTVTYTEDVCAVHEVETRLATTDPFSRMRPSEVPPGWRWIVIALEVRALKTNDLGREYCVPFGVHVYGTMTGGPVLAIMEDGLPHPLPYDRIRITPWSGTYFLLSYDPSSPRFATNPPVYSIELIATYLAERDITAIDGPPDAFRCALLVNGATVVADVKTKAGLAGRDGTARCTLQHNFFNV